MKFLLSGKQYFFSKQCLGLLLGSVMSCSVYAGPPQGTPPRKPTSISAPTVNFDGAYTVSWGESVPFTDYEPVSYRLQQSVNGGSYQTVYTGSSRSMSFSGKVDSDYSYRAAGCIQQTKCSDYTYVVTTRVVHPPSAPSTITLSANKALNCAEPDIEVDWSDASYTSYGSARYELHYRYHLYGGGWSSWYTVNANLTSSYLKHPVSQGYDYQYAVRAYYATSFGDTPKSAWIYSNSRRRPYCAPSVPSQPVGANIDPVTRQFNVDWGDASGTVTYYTLHERLSGTSSWNQVYSDSASIWVAANKTNGATYEYMAIACNVDQCSSGSSVSSIRLPYAKPSMPQLGDNVGGAAGYEGQYSISWSSQGGTVMTFIVEEQAPASSWQAVQPDSNGNSKYYDKPGNFTDAPINYLYHAKACNPDACSDWRQIQISVNNYPKPGRPVSLALDATPSSDGTYRLNWGKPSGPEIVSYYHLKQTSDNHAAHIAHVNGQSSYTQAFSGGISGQYYYYHVDACFADDNACSGFTEPALEIYIPYPIPSAPSGLTGPDLSYDGRYTLSWNATEHAARYELEQNLNNQIQAYNPQANTDYDMAVSTNGTHLYRVRGCNLDEVCGAWSDPVSVEVDIHIPQIDSNDPDAQAQWEALLPDAALIEPSVPVQEAVGAMAGEATVAGGAAAYTIPITLPPGLNGMQPQVSLNYSSRGGNGVAGIGWSLSAGSAIHRCAATVAQDGYKADVQYDAGRDRLCLDGQRLMVISGTYGASGAVYRTEIDQFARVTQTGSINGLNTYFTVETKEGRINRYGYEQQARHQAEGRNETLNWAIDESRDRSGNTMVYDYTDHGGGEYTLAAIHYTGTATTQGDRSVRFDYEDRIDAQQKTDYFTAYLAGGKNRQTQRLEKISTQYQSATVREYRLEYGGMSLSTGRSLLRSVQECGFQGASAHCLPAAQFEWQEAAPRYVLEPIEFKTSNGGSSQPHNTSLISNLVPRGDLNGDGTPDWPGIEDGNTVSSPGFHVNAEGEQTGTHNELLGSCFKPFNSAYQVQCLEADFNQDGRTDSIKKQSSTGTYQIKYAGQSSWINTGISYHQNVEQPLSFADFNGDGWPDMALRQFAAGSTQDLKLWIFLHSRNPTAPFSQNNKVLIWSYRYMNHNGIEKLIDDVNTIGDMDGNGTIDFIVFDNNQAPHMPIPHKLLFTHSQAGGGLTLSQYSFSGYMDLGASSAGKANFFHDVNADGLPDWLAVSGDETLSVKINQGGHFSASWQNLGVRLPMRQIGYLLGPQEPDFISLPVLAKTFPMDYNSDGRAELLFAKEVVASSCSLVTDRFGNHWRCDDTLWGLMQGPMDPEPLTPVAGEQMDVSARRYKAIYFDENAQGIITATVADTDIVAAANQKAAVDVTGDGLVDAITAFECMRPCQWNLDTASHSYTVQDGSLQNKPYINRNLGAWTGSPKDSTGRYQYAEMDVIKTVTNGLGVEDHWSYRPLSSHEYDQGSQPFYSPDHAYVNGGDITANDTQHFHFASSMVVVAEHKRSNGIGGLNGSRYRYRGATYHNQGRGFMGFRTIIVDDANGIRTVTDFHQKFPLAGETESMRTCLVSDNDPSCNNAPISQVRTGYLKHQTTNRGTWWVYPAKLIETGYELNGRLQLKQTVSFIGLIDPGSNMNALSVSSAAYDDYGNIKQTVTRVDTGFGVVETRKVRTWAAPDLNDWWLDILETTTETTKAITMTGVVWPVYDATLDGDKTVTTTIASYDPQGSRKPAVITTTPSEGKALTVTTIYNDYGLPTQVTTASANETPRVVTTTYSDDQYFIDTVTDDVGTQTMQINPYYGQPDSQTDMNGITATYEYDAFGRLEKTARPGIPNAYVRYANCNDCDGINNERVVYKVTALAAGAPQKTEYRDALNRVLLTKIKVLGGASSYVQREYDALGRLVFESVPSDSDSTAYGTYYESYDALNRLTRKLVTQTDLQNMRTDYHYGDAAASYAPYTTRISINDGERTLYRTYNSMEQLMQTIDSLPTPGVTQYAYDGQGNPIVMQDANGAKITAVYNALNQKRWVDDPNMGRKTFTYTGYGQVETETDANGNLARYEYDTRGRLTARIVSGPNETANNRYEYDGAQNQADKCRGLPSREYKDNGSAYAKEYFYTALCQLSLVKTVIDGQAFEVKTWIDGHYGRPKGVTYPNGFTLGYDYSDEGYLKRSYNAASGYTYRTITEVDASGQWTKANVARGQASIERAFYIETGQMEHTQWSTGNIAGQRLEYTYDSFGNLSQQTVQAAAGERMTETYAYDNMHRLLSSTRTHPTQGVRMTHYAFDAVGNVQKKSDFSADLDNAYEYLPVGSVRDASNGWAGPNAVRRVTLPDNSQRVYDYDQNGNLLSDGLRQMTYNAYNKPVRIQVLSGMINPVLDSEATGAHTADLYYGTDQLRYKQEKTGEGQRKVFVYIGKRYEQVLHYNGIGGLTLMEKKSYVDDIAVMTQTHTPNQADTYKTVYLHRDRLGSMTGQSDAAGTLIQGFSYDAFGRPRNEDLTDKQPRQQLNSEATNRGFTDHEHLDDAQLIHMNGRAYDYNLGRFLSVDPVIQDPGNSQSMNPYSYILNNPLSGTDPSGYSRCESTGKKSTCSEPAKRAELTKKVTVTHPGSRIATTMTVNMSQSSSGASVTVSGGNGALRNQYAKAIAGGMSASGFKVTGISASSGGGMLNTTAPENDSATKLDSSSAKSLETKLDEPKSDRTHEGMRGDDAGATSHQIYLVAERSGSDTSVGHVFIGGIDPDGNKVAYGFYPKNKSLGALIDNSKLDGLVLNDIKSFEKALSGDSDFAMKAFRVNESIYKNTIDAISSFDKRNGYGLLTCSCVQAAFRSLHEAGVIQMQSKQALLKPDDIYRILSSQFKE